MWFIQFLTCENLKDDLLLLCISNDGLCKTQHPVYRFSHWKTQLALERPQHLRLTSSLQVTTASPWAFMALQVYTPPSKVLGLRISREQMPCTQICLNLGSSPMIIWFFIHWTLGCGKITIYWRFVAYFTYNEQCTCFFFLFILILQYVARNDVGKLMCRIK